MTGGRRVVEAGDAALILQLGDVRLPITTALYDASLNRQAIAAAAEIRARDFPGVLDVLPTYRTVAVYFDPRVADVEELRSALSSAGGSPAADAASSVEIPVAYGGGNGPDLEEVAAFAGCDSAAVVQKHCAREYRVFMLGFLPGYPYMAPVEDAIAMPRRSSPRLRVPAGSVGIAGHQTGIYPSDSPGGWQIIGRTGRRLFDLTRNPPALLKPGDHVRFVPVDDAQITGQDPAGSYRDSVPAGVTVLKPGLLTTVQDSGRFGHQAVGVPPSGPMDPVSHRIANRLVGNPAGAAALEATLVGPQLRIEQRTVVGIAGADLSATVDGAALQPGSVADCRPGSVVQFGARSNGARAYVGFSGGIDVPPVLTSRATHLPSVMGGINGRPLQSGDTLPLGPGGAFESRRPGSIPSIPRIPAGGARLRVMLGPQADCFDEAVLAVLGKHRFIISPQSNRMGYRLTGATIPIGPHGGEMVSDAAFTGGLQVPPSGEPILLMADRQTTGGYPQIAVVISADIPVAGQLLPGDWVEFEWCTRATAIKALRDGFDDVPA